MKRDDEDDIEMKFFPLTGDHAGSPRNVTFHPVRECIEWKNIIPSAADFVGQGSTPPGEIHISKRTSVGLPQKLCFCGKEEAPADKVKHFRTGNASKKAGCRRHVVARKRDVSSSASVTLDPMRKAEP